MSSIRTAPLLTTSPSGEEEVDDAPLPTGELDLAVSALQVPAVRGARLSAAASFALLASVTVSFLAASSAPTPLYALYQSRWGFSPITITVIFGVYAIAVLATLLTVGSLSDYVGRRPVILVAIALQAASMLIFTSASGVGALLIARVVQGLAAGAAVGAIGAGMLDLDRVRGTLANAVAPMMGSATGGIVSGLMVQFLPAPAHLVYLVFFGVFALQGMGVAWMPETATRRPGALASLRPRFQLPLVVRRPVLLAAPLLVAAWALAGFYGSLGPSLIRKLVGSNAPLLGGLALFIIAGMGAVTVVLFRLWSPRSMTILGAASLITGVFATLLAIRLGSPALFFLGTAVAGAGFGAGFNGAIRTVLPLAAPDTRAGVLSVLFLISYLAMGVPAVLAGLRVVHGGGLLSTAREYGLTVMVLAATALLGALPRRPARGSLNSGA